MSNGRFRGVRNTPSLSGTGGVYRSGEQYDHRKDNTWPRLPRANQIMYLDAGRTDSYSGSGSTWYDLSPEGNDATVNGSPTHTSGIAGYFQMTTSDYFTVSGGCPHSFENGFTVFTLQMLQTDNSYETYMYIGNSSNHNDSILCRRWSNAEYIDVYVASGGVVKADFNTSTSILQNYDPHTYAWTMGGTNGHNFYRDGVFIENNSDTDLPDTKNDRAEWRLGRDYTGNSMDGRYHIAMVYNRELSANEVAALHGQFTTRYSI